MKVTVYSVVVDRDEMTKPSKQVWAWELPVLQSKFPGGLVHVNGSAFDERESLPNADEEFMRLERQYGVDPETKQAHVHLAYARGDSGVTMLAKAIKAAEWNAKTEAAKALKRAKATAAAAVKAQKELEAAEKKLLAAEAGAAAKATTKAAAPKTAKAKAAASDPLA